MTDNEILKAWECCTDCFNCPTDCPLFEDDRDCLLALNKPTLDLINRQKAENDELRENNKAIMQTIADVRESVVKEFAERLKEARFWFSSDLCVIDNLVKEMVGDTK